MRDPKQQTVPAEPHQQGRSLASIKPVSDAQNSSRSRAARFSVVQPSLNTSEATADSQEVQRHSRKTSQINQGTIHNTTKTLIDINHDLNLHLTERKQESQAQRLRYEKLKQDLDQMRAENDHLRQERDEVVNSQANLKYYSVRYNYLVKQFILPYAHEKSLQFDDRESETLNFVLSPLLQDARQAGMLRDQVQVLQQELLVREKRVSAISDEKFAQDFRKLAAHVKTLSRLLIPHEGVDVFEALGSGILVSGVVRHHWSGRAGRKLLIEAWIWSTLIQMVFRSPFTIFDTESIGISNLWSAMFGEEHYHGWPRPFPACETWRHTTMEQLVALVDEDIITQGKVKDCYCYLEQHVVNARAKTKSAIEARLMLIAPTTETSHVCQIVDNAFTLAMHMSLQRSRLQITFPQIGDRFNTTDMKLLPTLDEEDMEDGIVASIVNPGLTKWGDVHGRALDHRYDIVPALIQLRAPVLDSNVGISLV